jgi:peptide/nickel transport system permease protein
MLAGAMVVETVFALPGLGRLMVTAVLNKDFPLVQGAVMITALSFLSVNLIVDVLYSIIDPRIRTQG